MYVYSIYVICIYNNIYVYSLSILTYVFMTYNKEFLKITITPSVVIISHHSSLHIKYIFSFWIPSISPLCGIYSPLGAWGQITFITVINGNGKSI